MEATANAYDSKYNESGFLTTKPAKWEHEVSWWLLKCSIARDMAGFGQQEESQEAKGKLGDWVGVLESPQTRWINFDALTG